MTYVSIILTYVSVNSHSNRRLKLLNPKKGNRETDRPAGGCHRGRAEVCSGWVNRLTRPSRRFQKAGECFLSYLMEIYMKIRAQIISSNTELENLDHFVFLAVKLITSSYAGGFILLQMTYSWNFCNFQKWCKMEGRRSVPKSEI